MTTTNMLQLSIVIMLAVFLGESAEGAEKHTEWGSIKLMEAGWVEDTVAVHHSAPLLNPDHCKVEDGGYSTDPKDPGHSLFHTVLLSAFLNRKEVHLLISGCAYGKPRIIGVGIR